MIRAILLGLVCVAGVGAIAAATSKPAAVPIPPITYPIVSGNKADRLSLVSAQDIQPTVGTDELAFAPPPEPSVPVQPQPKELTKAKAPDFIPRHWHDPHDTRASLIKSKPERSKSTSRSSPATAKVVEVQDCGADSLSSLMRKLSLQPACGR